MRTAWLRRAVVVTTLIGLGAVTGCQPAAAPRAAEASAVPGAAPFSAAVLGADTAVVSGAIPATMFGMHVLHSTTAWPTVTVGSLRLWDTQTTWADLEPARGVWQWQRLDAIVRQAAAHHADLTMTLGQTPRWASARPFERGDLYGRGQAAEPAQLDDWRAYVHAVAERYKGRISSYEIWNEPNWRGMYTGSPRMLAELTRAAYQEVKQVDPHALVISPSFVPDDPRNDAWMLAYFRAGAGRYLDAVAVHLYSGRPEATLPLVAKVRRALAAADLQRLPLWNTEQSFGRVRLHHIFSAVEGGALLARAYLLTPYSGVSRTYWYAWDDYSFSGIRVTDPRTGVPTFAARAYRQVEAWMLGARETGCANAGSVWRCTLRRGTTTSVAMWTTDAHATTTVPAGFTTIRSLTGTTTRTTGGARLALTFVPVLLTK